MITCYQCGKELIEPDENEPYPWRLIEVNLYCRDCLDET